MSFLHKLWDETLAGPAPDSGLSRLRKYNSFSASRSPPMMLSNNIPRPIEIPSPTAQSPSSPVASSTSPETTPRGEEDVINRLRTRRRRTSIDYPRSRPLERPEPTTPSVYDWIVITALDR